MFLLIALLLVLTGPATPALGESIHREPGTVLRVVDGDTVDVQLGGRRERLRLIGLNTPETVDPRRPVECFGREASAKAKALLPAGTRVYVEQDPQQGQRDRYGRLLAYLILPDGRNFAEVMIADGYGFEYTYRLPYRYQERFRAAQARARAEQRGLWAPSACPERRPDAPQARRADPQAQGALRSAGRQPDS
ncbi:MAG TPA: thermonuclease family protein [Thermodesulfobacteriota bacterium]